MSNNRTLVSIVLAVSVIALIIGVSFFSSSGGTVATVNGEKITKEELYQLLVEQNGSQAVNQLVSQKIVELEAKKNNITVSEAEIQEKLAELKKSYGGDEAFATVLEYNNLSLEDLTKNLELNLKITKLLEPGISISDDEIAEYFETNKASFAVSDQVKASHILTETAEAAAEVKSKLDQGEDFSELTKQYSIDESSKDQGGDLGTFGKGKMTAKFEEAAFNLEIGQISEPVQTEFGYHIIKVDEKIQGKEANLEDSKEEIRQILLEQKVETEFDSWLQTKYAEYNIVNLL